MIIFETLIIFALAKKERDVAQLVARHVRDVEAAGSSPVIPTGSRQAIACRLFYLETFFCLLNNANFLKENGMHT